MDYKAMDYKDYVVCEDQWAYLNDAAVHFRKGIDSLEISLETGNKTLADEHGWAKDVLKSIEEECARLRRAMDKIEARQNHKNSLLFGWLKPDPYDYMEQRGG